VFNSKMAQANQPLCTVTWEWGRDEPGRTCIDRYTGADDFFIGHPLAVEME